MIAASPTSPENSEPQTRVAAPGYTRFAGPGILLLALALRLFQLGTQNLWYDENLTVAVSQSKGAELFKALELESNKPPLYFLMMQAWVKDGASEFWIRLPSAICGTLTCLLALALGQELFGKERGWLLGLLLAVSPFHVYYSQEARMYALLGLTGTAALLFTCWFCKAPTGRNAGLYLVAATLSCYTFTYGVFLMPFACLFSACFRPRLSGKALAGFWATNVLVALLFVPWVPRLLSTVQSGSGLQGTLRGPVTQALAYAFSSLGLGTTFGPTTEQLRVLGRRVLVEHPVASGCLLGGILLLTLVSGLGLLHLWRRNRNAFFFAAIGLGVFWGCPAVLNVLKPQIPYNARYAILALVPFLVAVSAFFLWAAAPGRGRKLLPTNQVAADVTPLHLNSGRSQSRLTSAATVQGFKVQTMARGILTLAFAGCVGLSLANHYFAPRYGRDEIRAAANFIQSLQPPPGNLLVCADYMKLSIAYYYSGPAKILPLKISGPTVETAVEPLVKELASGGTFGLVYTRPDHGDPQRVLPAWLKAHYQLKLEKSWTGVTFYLFEAAPPPPPR